MPRVSPRRWVGGVGVVGTALVLASGCSEFEKPNDDARTMSKFSSSGYNDGYKDGMRDAKMSLFDDHAGWMWLWMVEKGYQDGYQRGWSDGRSMVKLEKQQTATDEQDDRQAKEQLE